MGGGEGYAGIASGVLGGVGSVVSSAMAKSTAKKAAQDQKNALKKIQADLTKNLDPKMIADMAAAQDAARAQARLDLQAKIDPALAAQRSLSEDLITRQLTQIGKAPSDEIAALAASEGAKQTPGMEEMKRSLIDAALEDMRSGATLPPDVQAELMQAGLQQAGQVTGSAGGARGSVGSSILSQVLGTAGLQLQAQRRQEAAGLTAAASNLDAQRQQILQSLFPKLQAQQMQNLSAASGVLQQSNQMMPQAGLSGADVASLWLQRVGALNQNTGQLGTLAANATLAQGQAKQNIWGTVTSVGQWKPPGQGQQGGGDSTLSGLASFFNSSPSATSTPAGGLGATGSQQNQMFSSYMG